MSYISVSSRLINRSLSVGVSVSAEVTSIDRLRREPIDIHRVGPGFESVV